MRRGTDVTFTATSRGAVVSTPNWRFDVDSGVTNETTICGGLSGPNPCLVTVRTSGVLRASKNVQGRMRVAAARVRVYTEFTLTGEPSDVVRGDSVHFTPKLDGVTGPAARWLWRGDDATVVAAPCAAQTDTCVWVPQSSGTMWAYTAASGGDSASKHVTVTPPTFTLSTSTNFVHLDGDTVSFSVTGGPVPLVINGWKFIPDPVPTDSGFPPQGDRLTFSQPRLSRSGGGVQIKPPTGANLDIADGSSFQDCSPGTANCAPYITTSGWLRVSGTVAGIAKVDSAHVYVDNPIDSLAVEPPNVRFQCPPDYGETWMPWTMTSTTGVAVLIQPPIYRIPGEVFPNAGTFDANYANIPWAKYRPLIAITETVPPLTADAEIFYVCKTWVIGESPSGKLLWGGRVISEGGKIILP